LNFNISVRTELGTDVKIPAEASLSWPHLFSTQLLEFSPTTIGNSTVSDKVSSSVIQDVLAVSEWIYTYYEAIVIIVCS